jgi:hypothetical protein
MKTGGEEEGRIRAQNSKSLRTPLEFSALPAFLKLETRRTLRNSERAERSFRGREEDQA